MVQATGLKKIPPHKRNELNQLLDKILKVSSSVPESANVAKEWEAYQEIQKLLSKVKQLESDLLQPLASRSSAIDEFLLWLRNNNVEFDGLKIAEYPGLDLGIEAEKDFKEGDMMIAVPRSVMLTVENIQHSPFKELAKKDPLLVNMPNVALSLLLLLQRHDPKSFWKPYMNMLPQKYTTVLYFTPDEILQLKGSPAYEMALRQCRSIARQYAYFNKLFQRSGDEASTMLREVFTYEDYCWAVSTVMTRQNTVVSADGSALTQALIPLWDMCNHADGKLSTDFNVSLDRSECVAWRPVARGAQVFIYYGDRPNCDLLIHNGFVHPRSACDAVRLRLGVARADPLHAEKAALLARLGLPTAGDWEVRAGPRPVPGRLRAFVRVFCMDKGQLEQWAASPAPESLLREDAEVDAAVEDRARAFLATRIKLLLAAYPTRREDDEALLDGAQGAPARLTPCARLAVMLRLEEKRVLEQAAAHVEKK